MGLFQRAAQALHNGFRAAGNAAIGVGRAVGGFAQRGAKAAEFGAKALVGGAKFAGRTAYKVGDFLINKALPAAASGTRAAAGFVGRNAGAIAGGAEYFGGAKGLAAAQSISSGVQKAASGLSTAEALVDRGKSIARDAANIARSADPSNVEGTVAGVRSVIGQGLSLRSDVDKALTQGKAAAASGVTAAKRLLGGGDVNSRIAKRFKA